MAEVPVPPACGDPRALTALFAALGEARYIGGWVRDTLLGQPSADIDVATPVPPADALARLAAAGLPTWSSASGLAHGTIGVVIAGRTIEVTTLRRDVATDGRHAEVAFTDDWQADAARRDFTFNALSADPATGAIHDYFGGLADLAAGRVRFIGDAATRIAEDRLRILRFFRFHARFGRGAADATGYAACVAHAGELAALSYERIAGELLKLLAVADPMAAVRAMIAGAVLDAVLPEAADDDRLARLIAAEAAAGVAPDGLRRLAALLPADPAVADAVAVRLRLSKADRRRLTLDAAPVGDGAARAAAYRDGAAATVDRLLIAGRGHEAAALAGWRRPVFPLTGGALIARGMAPGPAVAATLRRIEARWVAEGFADARVAALVDEALADAGVPPP